jgi:hypothetical protein
MNDKDKSDIFEFCKSLKIELNDKDLLYIVKNFTILTAHEKEELINNLKIEN